MRTVLSTLLAAVVCLSLAAAASAAGPVKLLFVDTGNTGRSISAETIARIHAAATGRRVLVISRGVDADPFERQVEMNAQILWLERGIDLSQHRAEQITPQDVKRATLILCLTAKHAARVVESYPEAKDKVFVLSEYAVGRAEDIEDPYGKPIEAYRTMLADLDRLVPAAVDRATAPTAGTAAAE